MLEVPCMGLISLTVIVGFGMEGWVKLLLWKNGNTMRCYLAEKWGQNCLGQVYMVV